MRWIKKIYKIGDMRKVRRFAWIPVEDIYGNGVWLEFYYAYQEYEGGGIWGLYKIEYENKESDG